MGYGVSPYGVPVPPPPYGVPPPPYGVPVPQAFAPIPSYQPGTIYAVPQAQSRAYGANPEFASYGVPTTGPDFSQTNTPMDPTNLFIQGLPIEIDENQLRAMFEPFGQVVSTKIMVDPATQTSRGFGFVKFTSPASATTAIESMHEATVSGKKLGVKHAALTSRSANVGTGASGGSPNANLYIRGIPLGLSNEDLQALFAQYGGIEQSRILLDTTTGLSKGQAFVRYHAVESANLAIQALNGMTFDDGIGSTLLVKYADTDADKARGRGGKDSSGVGRGRGGRFMPYSGGPGQLMGIPVQGQSFPEAGKTGAIGPNGEANLFVYHLPTSADDTMLQTLFANYGPIVSVRVMRDPATGLCKGFGFVKMVNVESANSAIAALNGYQIENKRLSVSFKK